MIPHNVLSSLRLVLLPLYSMMIPVQEQAVKPSNVERIARITGNSLPHENFPNSNNTAALWDIGGTDLGIAWRMGDGRTGFWFGDTYGRDWKVTGEGGPGKAGNWRSNVLAFSSDEVLTDGIRFDAMLNKEIIPSLHITDGSGNHTTIPTAAVHAHGEDYVHYMEIRKWGKPGSWATNKSGLYSSADKGQSWKECPEVVFSGTSNFAQAAFANKEGYVYMMGTPSGRWGAIYLARVEDSAMESIQAYEYWDGERWVKNQEKRARAIIPAPAGEMSLIWHSDFKRWIVSYLNEKKGELVIRSTREITGPWSEEQSLAKASDYPGLYGAFIHPSSTKGDKLYFLMSMWQPYNVFLMQADLKL